MGYRRSQQPWDFGPARFWAVCLLATLVMPLGFRPTRFLWDLFGMELGDEKGTIVLSLLLPYVLAIATLVALKVASGASKARGAVYAGCALLVLLFGYRQLSGSFLGAGRSTREMSGVLLIVSVFIIGPALIAAGNRVQRREAGQKLARIVAGLGGLALAAGFFIPMNRGFGGDHMLIEMFGESRVWEDAWWLNLWLALVLIFGLLGAALLFPSARPAHERGAGVSRLARIIPIGLALMLLITAMMGPSEHVGSILLTMVRGLLQVFGVVILLAIGLALLLEETAHEPEAVDHADAF